MPRCKNKYVCLTNLKYAFTANEEATVHFSACFISTAGQNIKTNITDNLGANSISLHFPLFPRDEIN